MLRFVWVGKGFPWGSALTLLEAGVLLVDNEQLALASDDLAVRAAFFDCRSDFHILCFASAGRAGSVMNDRLPICT
jgi:hypothetical protein